MLFGKFCLTIVPTSSKQNRYGYHTEDKLLNSTFFCTNISELSVIINLYSSLFCFSFDCKEDRPIFCPAIKKTSPVWAANKAGRPALPHQLAPCHLNLANLRENWNSFGESQVTYLYILFCINRYTSASVLKIGIAIMRIALKAFVAIFLYPKKVLLLTSKKGRVSFTSFDYVPETVFSENSVWIRKNSLCMITEFFFINDEHYKNLSIVPQQCVQWIFRYLHRDFIVEKYILYLLTYSFRASTFRNGAGFKNKVIGVMVYF